ncbi:MAG: GlsB/YeaQ/YmgE family stress response membrane protein [Chloroflexota bacterium]|nr:GlsB/YeaQ/YmgE family stress response membrane protein [Chloroflexota bacterium]
MIGEIIAWLVLGAIAGYLAGMLVKGDEGLGIVGKIVLGIIGAVVGGTLWRLISGEGLDFGGSNDINVVSIVVAVIGAVIAVVVYGMVTGNRRTGSGPIYAAVDSPGSAGRQISRIKTSTRGVGVFFMSQYQYPRPIPRTPPVPHQTTLGPPCSPM